MIRVKGYGVRVKEKISQHPPVAFSMKKTLVLKIDPKNPDTKLISRAAKVLREGGLVAFPTETVYGLGANMLDKKALDKLYEVKKRPKAKPFTAHIAALKTIRELGCAITKEAQAFVDKFWPGPLTLILKSKDGGRIGFRMPDNNIALELIRSSKVPVAAPSANYSGKSAPTTAEDVLKQLDGKIDIVLDGGATHIGIESTIMDLTSEPFRILREGAIKRRELLKEPA